MSRLKAEVIKYSKKLNITNLSALRSGNISVRAKEKGIDGFYITPSGMKYASLKPKDIIYVEPLAKKFYVLSNLSGAVSLIISTITLYLLINN